MTTERAKESHEPDPHAVAVARAAANAVSPARVVLFGSRARGDHRPDSNINLLVISRNANPDGAADLARTAARRFMETSGEANQRLSIESMSHADFERRRQKDGDVAHRAAAEGIPIN